VAKRRVDGGLAELRYARARSTVIKRASLLAVPLVEPANWTHKASADRWLGIAITHTAPTYRIAPTLSRDVTTGASTQY